MNEILRCIAVDYFNDHSDARDEVMKAYFAYQAGHFRAEPAGHNFPSSLRISKCLWCSRSREMVRWDELPPQCQKRPKMADAAEVISSEEEKFFSLLNRASLEVPKIIKKRGMSGETLAFLHQTHGYDPEIVSGVVNVPQFLMREYHEKMDEERARSRASLTKEIITIKTN